MNELSNKMIRLICLCKAVEVLGPNRFRFTETHEVTEPFLEAAKRFHEFVSAAEATEAAETLETPETLDVDPEIALMCRMWKQSIQLPGLLTIEEAAHFCPVGFQLPTLDEYKWLLTHSKYHHFDKETEECVLYLPDGSELRFRAAGQRHKNGATINQGQEGFYLSSTLENTNVYCLRVNSIATSTERISRVKALSTIYLPEKIDHQFS